MTSGGRFVMTPDVFEMRITRNLYVFKTEKGHCFYPVLSGCCWRYSSLCNQFLSSALGDDAGDGADGFAADWCARRVLQFERRFDALLLRGKTRFARGADTWTWQRG